MEYEREKEIIRLANSGLTANEIAKELGYKSRNQIYEVCNRNGVKLNKGSAGEKKKAMEQMLSGGATMREVAEAFGYTKRYLEKILCDTEAYANRNVPTTPYKTDDMVAQWVTERKPEWEYVDGYTGTDGRANIMHKKCGHIKNVPMCQVRKIGSTIVCKYCESVERNKAAEVKAIENARKNAKRLARRDDMAKQVEYIVLTCNDCGKTFLANRRGQKRCKACAKKEINNHHDKRIKKEAVVDKDITLTALLKRDYGVCWLCGEQVDPDDYATTEKGIVCGDMYPSIDHVYPLSKGGKHSWNNVKLAHRRCNYLKSDKVI